MKITEPTVLRVLKVANSLLLLEKMGRVKFPKDKTRTQVLAHEVWRELDNSSKD